MRAFRQLNNMMRSGASAAAAPDAVDAPDAAAAADASMNHLVHSSVLSPVCAPSRKNITPRDDRSAGGEEPPSLLATDPDASLGTGGSKTVCPRPGQCVSARPLRKVSGRAPAANACGFVEERRRRGCVRAIHVENNVPPTATIVLRLGTREAVKQSLGWANLLALRRRWVGGPCPEPPLAAQRDRERRVDPLVVPGEAQLHISKRLERHRVPQGRSDARRCALEDLGSLGELWGGEAGHAGLHDARLLAGDEGEGVAQDLHVVVAERRDAADDGAGHGVGGVEAAAEAHLEDHDVHLRMRGPL